MNGKQALTSILVCVIAAGLAVGCGGGTTTPADANAGTDGGAGTAWFDEYVDLPLTLPQTNKFGDPTGGSSVAGGEAVAIFDANGDGLEDIVFVTGAPYYHVVLNSRDAHGDHHFDVQPPAYVGVVGDQKANLPVGLGLHDFDGNGLLDLYLCNMGRGGLQLRNRRPPWDVSAANQNDAHTYHDSGYRTQISNGDGTFSYRELNANAEGITRTAVFADFDGDGFTDMLTSNAAYYGVWWGGSAASNELRPGRVGGSFGEDLLGTAVSNDPGDLWKDAHGRANKDFKGIVVRDFDGDGRPDVVLAAFSDVWDDVMRPPFGTADPSGADLDLDGDGLGEGGYQGEWKRGILVLHNTSSPGHIRFEDVSAAAMDNAFGSTDQMHVYVTVPADIDNDGDLDLLVSGPRYFFAVGSLAHQTDRVRVYRNDSTPGSIRFTNITAETGIGAINDDARLPELTDGVYPVVVPGVMLDGSDFVMTPLLSAAAALDIDNDGWVDWVLIDRQLLASNPYTGVEFNAWVLRNEGEGRFARVPAAVHGLLHTSRELSYADLNGDGRLDLVLANDSGGGQTVGNNNYVYLNLLASSNHWIDIRVNLPGNALGIGTKVTVYERGTTRILGYDEVRTDFAYRSKRPASVHFGLGPVDGVDVALRFPDGRQKTASGLQVNRLHVLGP